MPHVVVKLWPGKSEQQKTQLAVAIVKDVTRILNYGEKSVSVAMEENRSAGLGRKVVVITGASSGLGEAAARHLVREGAQLVLGARRLQHASARTGTLAWGRRVCAH